MRIAYNMSDGKQYIYSQTSREYSAIKKLVATGKGVIAYADTLINVQHVCSIDILERD